MKSIWCPFSAAFLVCGLLPSCETIRDLRNNDAAVRIVSVAARIGAQSLAEKEPQIADILRAILETLKTSQIDLSSQVRFTWLSENEEHGAILAEFFDPYVDAINDEARTVSERAFALKQFADAIADILPPETGAK